MVRRSPRARKVVKVESDHENDPLNPPSLLQIAELPARDALPRTKKKRKRQPDHQSVKDQVEAFNMKPMKKGSLRKVTEMPLDILFEIFSKLQPLDLLNLARTTKQLRSILMKKNIISVWRSARANAIGLPACPDDLTEPQYAELVFGQHCHFCGKAGDKNRMAIRTRIRTCPACAFQESKLVYNAFTVWRAIPHQIDVLLPRIAIKAPQKRRPERRVPRKIIREWEESYTMAKDATEWIANKKTLVEAEKIHEADLQTFLEGYISEQLGKKMALADTKRLMLIEHAKSLGWYEEIEAQGYEATIFILINSPVIEKACNKDVSIKGFKLLEDEINRVFSEARVTRLRLEQKERLIQTIIVLANTRRQCVSFRPLDEPQPSIGDLLHLHDGIRAACIKFANGMAMFSAEEELRFVGDAFSVIREHWIRRCRKYLIDTLDQTGATKATTPVGGPSLLARSQESSMSLDVLQLATSFFRCSSSRCGSPQLRFPSVLSHPCARKIPIGGHGRGNLQDWVYDALYDIEDTNDEDGDASGEWNLDEIIQAPSSDAMRHCLAILEILNLDPKTTTSAQLFELDPIFECVVCNNAEEGRRVMTWETAISHAINGPRPCKDNKNTRSKLRLLDGPLVERAREGINVATQRHRCKESYKGDTTTMMCTILRCMKKGNLTEIRQHIRRDHFCHPEEGDVIVVPGLQNERKAAWLWPPREDLSLGLATADSAEIPWHF